MKGSCRNNREDGGFYYVECSIFPIYSNRYLSRLSLKIDLILCYTLKIIKESNIQRLYSSYCVRKIISQLSLFVLNDRRKIIIRFSEGSFCQTVFNLRALNPSHALLMSMKIIVEGVC